MRYTAPMMLPWVFLLSSVVPMLVLSALMVRFDPDRPATGWLLAALTQTVAILTICSGVLGSFLFSRYFPIAHLGNLSILALLPLFYLFVKSAVSASFRLRKSFFLLFLPFCACFAAYAFMNARQEPFTGVHYRLAVFKFAEIAQAAAYFPLVALELSRAGISAKRALTDFRDRTLTWVRILFLLVFLVVCLKLQSGFLYDRFANPRVYLQNLAVYYAFLASVLFLSLFYGLGSRQADHAGASAVRYRGSSLTESEIVRIYDRLLAYIERERPYLDPDLSLSTLAERSGIQAKALSRAVNEKAGMNFNDFVNEFRVREACRLIDAKPDGVSILVVLYDSGFNSKSTFNTAFKKRMGMTPSAYRDRSVNP